MKLTQLLHALSEAEILHLPEDTDVSGVTCDSRQVNPGFVFVAIPGALTDGHLYIEEAIRRGAVAIVVERPQSLDKAAEIKVPNARRALAELSRRFFHYPDLDLFMVGVTATNGKTTTTSMVQHILRSYGIETAVIGSVAYSYGDVRVKSNLTTPESSDLHAMLAEQRDDGVKVVSMEVSSIAEAQYRVYGINYDIVCFLNITPDHMPDHGTFEQYYLEKLKLVERVSEGVPVILNRDDPRVYEARHVTPGDVITISIDHRDVTIIADSLNMAGGIPSFKYTVLEPFMTLEGERESGSWQVNLKVAGRHSVYNAMAAITIVYGGGQQKNLRSGTENVPGAYALALALQSHVMRMDEQREHVASLRSLFLRSIDALRIPRVVISPDGASPYVLSIAFPGIRGETLLNALSEENIYISTGSACGSKRAGENHVLSAMGHDKETILSAVRISFAPTQSTDDVEHLVRRIAELYDRYAMHGKRRGGARG
jgi:UDP-N-acetylmuramyl pentapeptide synthase